MIVSVAKTLFFAASLVTGELIVMVSVSVLTTLFGPAPAAAVAIKLL